MVNFFFPELFGSPLDDRSFEKTEGADDMFEKGCLLTGGLEKADL